MQKFFKRSLYSIVMLLILVQSSFAANQVLLSVDYIPNPSIGRALSLADIYVGTVDLDPKVVVNQKQISVLQENGTTVQVAQPITTSAGGVPLYNGSPVTILVEGSYSLRIDDSTGSQQYYVPQNSVSSPLLESIGSIADLKAIDYTPDGGDIVNVTGYYASTENEDWNFQWSLTDLSTEVAADTQSGFYVALDGTDGSTGAFVRLYSGIISAAWFGVTSDGSTDDSTAWNGLGVVVPTGATVRVPPGTSICEDVDLSDIKLIGEKNSSIIKHKTNSTTPMLNLTGNIELDGVQFDGDKDNQTTRNTLLSFSGTTLKMYNCIITKSVAEGVLIAAGTDIDIHNNDFTDLAGHGGVTNENSYGVYVESMSAESVLNIHHNKFLNGAPSAPDLAGSAISLSAGKDLIKSLSIHHNSVDGFGQSFAVNEVGAIDVYQDGYNGSIHNNTLKNCYYTAIRALDCNNINIQNNVITDSTVPTASAISWVSGIHDLTQQNSCSVISGNTVRDWSGSGMNVAGTIGFLGRSVIVANNILKDLGGQGIALTRLEGKIALNSNTIDGCVGNGITLNDISGSVNIQGGTIEGVTGTPIYGRTSLLTAIISVNGVTIDADGLSLPGSFRDVESVSINNCTITGTPTSYWDLVSIERLEVDNNNSEDDWLRGSLLYDPAAIATGALIAQSVAAPGARLGDYCQVSWSGDLSDIDLTGSVTSSNNVTVLFINNTGVSRNLDEETIKVIVSKRY